MRRDTDAETGSGPLFLSYSRTDEAAVKVLAQGLEAGRRQIWYDHELGGGDAWWVKILANIRSASVFIFALSDHSLHSKPCLSELAYAQALGRPILPVQVGPVANFRANPLADIHTIVFRTDEVRAAFEIFAAVDEAAQRLLPLPDPLPPEPAIPFAYLQALGRQIDSTELDQADQTVVVDQLRKALGDETDESVRQEILAMLRNLRGKPWATRRTDREVHALIITHFPGADPATGTSTALRRQESSKEKVAESAREQADEEKPATQRLASSPDPPGREIFARRMEEIRLQREAEEHRRAEGERLRAQLPATGWQPLAATRPAPAAGSQQTPLWRGVSQPLPQPMPELQREPAPRWQPPTPSPQPSQPAATPPPDFWALSIVSFLLSYLFGGIAMYFSYQVGQRFQAGDANGAAQASRSAKTWAMIGIVLGSLCLLAVLGGA